MSAGYRPQVGDTVDTVTGHGRCVVLLGPDSAGDFVVQDSDGEFWVQPARNLVKVEPTPADRYMVFDSEGAPVTQQVFEDARNARNFAGEVFRVARFSFAGLVDAEDEL